MNHYPVLRLTGFRSPILKSASALILLVVGVPLFFFSLFGPSFWYTVTAAIVPAAGLVWFWRPFVAARLLIAPLLFFAPLAVLSKPFQLGNLVLIIASLTVIWLIANEFAVSGRHGLSVVLLSFALMLTFFLVERMFTNRHSVESRSMQWSTPRAVPWASTYTPIGEADEVELFRELPGGYCTDAIANGELMAHLAKSGKTAVEVQYNVTRDFGKLRGYTIRSVDGLLFATYDRMYRNGELHGGRVGTPQGSARDPAT